jgi:transcriptional regulator with XRE-family HTH domain
MYRDSKKTLATNVKALATKNFGIKFQGKLVEAGIKNGTVTRLLEGNTSIGLDLLDQLARLFNVEPYQLLVRNLDTADMPVAIPEHKAREAEAGAIALEALRRIKASSSQ